MQTSTINQVNNKLKSLPEKLLKEVENYIDFLAFKYLQEDAPEIQQWQKDIVMERMNNPQKPVDALKMVEDLERD